MTVGCGSEEEEKDGVELEIASVIGISIAVTSPSSSLSTEHDDT